jgi:photosystem II stability/assembly factor-like uncharacterized protein
MQKARVSIVAVAAVLALLFVSGAAAQSAMKLLTSQTGWVLMRGHLYWTTDGGSDWADITPPLARVASPAGNPDTIVSVFFLDTSNGWAALKHGGTSTGEWHFDLASTSDAGSTWSVTPVVVPNWNPNAETLGGGGGVDFIDPTHGWMNLSLVSSTNFDLGLLLSTADGGRTWQTVPGAPRIDAQVRFVTPRDGWLAGGPGGQDLYATHDAGATWTRVVLRTPVQTGAAIYPAYRLPVFADAAHGAVMVSYSGGAGPGYALALFATRDGGRAWSQVTAVPNLSLAEITAVAAADSELLTAEVSGRTNLVLTAFSGGGEGRRTTGAIPSNPGAVTQLSFRSPQRGWALAGWLYSTTDGGETWTDITPAPPGPGPRPVAKPQQPRGAPTALPSGRTTARARFQAATAETRTGGVDPVHTSAHLGFDTCEATTEANMQTWWTASPYYDTGIYIGGVNRSCAQPYLNSSWASTVSSYGWGLMAIWVGLQAPCNTGVKTFSKNTKVAMGQGEKEASSAETAASNLGLSNTIIYYDMEQYDSTNSACAAAVKAFVEGWVTQLKNDKYWAGVYTGSVDAQADVWTASPQPDDIWIALYDAQATIWGLDHVSGGLADSTWGAGFRAHQYFNYPKNVSGGETYGGVPFDCPNQCIDRDIEYAQADGGNGAKTYAFSYSQYDYPGADATSALGINDAGLGQIGASLEDFVGSYSVNCAVACQLYGFEELSGNAPSSIACGPGTAAYGISNPLLTFNPPLSLAGIGGGVGFWGNCTPIAYGQVFGINDDGQAVGWYADSSGNAQGFVYDTNTGTVVMNINFPGATNTYAYGINGFGQIVGNYDNGSFPPHGFVYDPGPLTPNGPYATVDVCGANGSLLKGISNNEQIVGYCASGASETSLSFVCAYLAGSCSGSPGSISVAGATGPTYVFGINDGPQAVGEYYDTPSGPIHGFLALPQQ